MSTALMAVSVEVPTATCKHHWVLESDSSDETVGVCRHCGAVRTFQNHLPGDRYAKEWREARLYGTVPDRKFAPLAATAASRESSYDG
ncbi:MAG: hypothetical protein U0556_01240 [Dehalococcoidia bacterium]